MKPDYTKMTRQELKTYVLSHRDDQEAIDVLISRRSPDTEATWYDIDLSPAQIQNVLAQKLKLNQ